MLQYVHYETEHLLFTNNQYMIHDVNKDRKSHFNIKTILNIYSLSSLLAFFITTILTYCIMIMMNIKLTACSISLKL